MGAKKIWTIGRDDDCDIKINSNNVSRNQAELVLTEGQYFLVNKSKHSTSFIKRGSEKIRVNRQKLQKGDLLYFADQGPYNFETLVDSDPDQCRGEGLRDGGERMQGVALDVGRVGLVNQFAVSDDEHAQDVSEACLCDHLACDGFDPPGIDPLRL